MVSCITKSMFKEEYEPFKNPRGEYQPRRMWKSVHSGNVAKGFGS